MLNCSIFLLSIILGLLFPGCKTFNHNNSPINADKEFQKEIYENGFREGIRKAIEISTKEKKDKPYYNWQSPMVQEVWIPPSITGGVFIPGHNEYVIILPGKWREDYSYPLHSNDSRRREPQPRGEKEKMLK